MNILAQYNLEMLVYIHWSQKSIFHLVTWFLIYLLYVEIGHI